MQWDLLDKVVPQNASRILQNPYINRNNSRILLNRRATIARLRVEQFAQLAETGETPITFLGNEPVVGI